MYSISQEIPVHREAKAIIVITTGVYRITPGCPIGSLHGGGFVYLDQDLISVTHPAINQSNPTLHHVGQGII